ATSFDGDVAYGSEPGVAGIGGRRAIELDALGIHSGAKQGHIVFPADDCAELTQRSHKYGQGRAVAIAPDEALRSSRHELAVLAEESAIRREKEDGAIESACVAFHDANDEVNV